MRSQFDDGSQRPDAAEVVAQVTDVFRRNTRRAGPIIAIIVVIGLLVAGVYIVGPGEKGIVRTFGKYTSTAEPGAHFRLPILQQVDVVNVEQIQRIEVGFRNDKHLVSEAQMLTGDENIVEAEMIVQYRIADPVKYLFELRDPKEALHETAQVALRSMVGRTSIDDVITTGRGKVQSETREWLQKLMDAYQSGLAVTEVRLQAVEPPEEVKESFHEVVRAREKKEELINTAYGYSEDVLPKARGEAQAMIREAEGYKEQRVNQARGDAAKFEAMYAEYIKAERVTRKRLYLEAMERILGTVEHKVIVDESVSSGMLPVLPLGNKAVGGIVAQQAVKQ